MLTYKVWDTINGEEDDANLIEADSPEEAARLYAEQDIDGLNDGLYHKHSQPIAVDGAVYNVSAEMEPRFRARKAKA